MNAPWKPAGVAHREPFVAYVCDETTAEALRPIASEMGWSAEKVNKGGLRNAVQSLSVSASPQVLFVDLSESGDPLNDINALAEVCEPGTVVIAAGQVNDVRLYRDLTASGIQDYLLKPLTADMLREAFGNAQAILNAPKLADASVDRPHCATAIIGTRGGAGASTIATSIAWLMSEKGGRTDGVARPRRAFRHRRAGARPRAGPRPDRRDRESQPDRRAVHRTRDGQGQRAARGVVGRSADQLADDDRWLGLLSVAGRDARGVRMHRRRSAARHAGPASRT